MDAKSEDDEFLLDNYESDEEERRGKAINGPDSNLSKEVRDLLAK